MDIVISENKLKSICQNIIDTELDSIRSESDDWGLGEMWELQVLNSISKIVVDKVVPHKRILILVDLYVKDEDLEYDDILSELRYRVEKNWFPNSFIQVNEFIIE